MDNKLLKELLNTVQVIGAIYLYHKIPTIPVRNSLVTDKYNFKSRADKETLRYLLTYMDSLVYVVPEGIKKKQFIKIQNTFKEAWNILYNEEI